MLTYILWVIIAFYLLGYIARLLFRLWLRRQHKRFGGEGGSFRTYTWGMGNRTQEKPGREEGKVYVEKSGRIDKKVSNTVGDYVEYEEIEEISVCGNVETSETEQK